MPFTLPGDPPADDADDKLITTHRERVQEREVRLAAQRILAHHLRPGADPDHPVETFWADIDLDLTAATLINLDLNHCTMRDAVFAQATFTGDAWFVQATFTGDAGFTDATFTSHAGFLNATFAGDAGFDRASFTLLATFEEATFAGSAGFTGATFTSLVTFEKASFMRAGFAEVTFAGSAGFADVTFTDYASFSQANFTDNANFSRATFTDVSFSNATLPSTRYANFGTPSPWHTFAGAQFAGKVPPEVAGLVPPPDEAPGDLDEEEQSSKQ
jgi:uncharacterized protein YjbI with pentapeptide repeats